MPTSNTTAASARVIRIHPGLPGVREELAELWHARDLLWMMAVKDVRLRYKQTIIGVVWAVLQPVLGMLLFTVVFGKVARLPVDDIAYPVFYLAGLIVWTGFAATLSQSANALVNNQYLIRKAWLPRAALPLATVVVSVLDALVALPILAGVAWHHGYPPTLQWLWIPVWLALGFAAAIGPGLALSAINAKFRDVRHALPFAIQLGLFASPVAYATSAVPEAWRGWFILNPLCAAIEGIRAAVTGRPLPEPAIVAPGIIVTVVLLLAGWMTFRRINLRLTDFV